MRVSRKAAGSLALLEYISFRCYPEPEPEFVFAPPRKWAFDLCWPARLIALEIEGGVWTRGRHTRGAGFTNDCLKYNAAGLLGYRVFRVTTDMVTDGRAFALLDSLFLGNRG